MDPKFANEAGICVPEIMFPAESVDLSKWACVACDQYTSQPDYWEVLSQLSREVFLSAIQRGVWSMRPRNLPCVQRSRQRTDVVIHGWHS